MDKQINEWLFNGKKRKEAEEADRVANLKDIHDTKEKIESHKKNGSDSSEDENRLRHLNNYHNRFYVKDKENAQYDERKKKAIEGLKVGGRALAGAVAVAGIAAGSKYVYNKLKARREAKRKAREQEKNDTSHTKKK